MIWMAGDTIFYKKGVRDLDCCVLEFAVISDKYYGDLKTESFDIEKKSFIEFLTASIIYFIRFILNFIDKNVSTAVMFLCLGFSFLCLATIYLDKNQSKYK